jgi:hypothetical protein
MISQKNHTATDQENHTAQRDHPHRRLHLRFVNRDKPESYGQWKGPKGDTQQPQDNSSAFRLAHFY